MDPRTLGIGQLRSELANRDISPIGNKNNQIHYRFISRQTKFICGLKHQK
jgi:hypothetical protein